MKVLTGNVGCYSQQRRMIVDKYLFLSNSSSNRSFKSSSKSSPKSSYLDKRHPASSEGRSTVIEEKFLGQEVEMKVTLSRVAFIIYSDLLKQARALNIGFGVCGYLKLRTFRRQKKFENDKKEHVIRDKLVGNFWWDIFPDSREVIDVKRY